MNTENSKTNEPHRFRLTLADKRNLKCTNKNMGLANLSIYYTWKNIKSAYNNNELKISTSAWNDEFDLLDRSYSISDIQDYFEYIIKEHENITDNSPVQIYHKNYYLLKQWNYYEVQKKMLIELKMEKMYPN